MESKADYNYIGTELKSTTYELLKDKSGRNPRLRACFDDRSLFFVSLSDYSHALIFLMALTTMFLFLSS